MIPKRKYEYVIIRNDKEIGINKYGFDYLINLEKVLDEIREYIEHEWFKRGQLGIIDKSFQEWQLKDILQILDKVNINPNDMTKMFENCTTLEPFLEYIDKVKDGK